MKRALSLKDVSKALGVSTATISNAFNRPDQLSKQLRQRILAECKTMGYSGPSLVARSLRSGRSDVVGVMLIDSLAYSFSDPMANKLLEGVSEVLAKHQKQMLLLSSSVDTPAQVRTESLPDGFIFYGSPNGHSFERIRNSGKPCITVDFTFDDLPAVNIDNYSSAKQLAQHAVHGEQDHVAIIGMRIIATPEITSLQDAPNAKPNHVEIAVERLQGYTNGALHKGKQISNHDIVHIPVNTREHAETAARLLLSRDKRPNVILCMSDIIAIAVCDEAHKLGIKVPEQLRVTGFDDIPAAARNRPALTTVCQQGIEKGRLATQMLLTGSDEQVILPAKFIQRKST